MQKLAFLSTTDASCACFTFLSMVGGRRQGSGSYLQCDTSEHIIISVTNDMVVNSLSLVQELGAWEKTDPSFLKFETGCNFAIYVISFCLSGRSIASNVGMADQKNVVWGFFFSACGITNLLLPQTVAYQEQSSRLTAMHPKQG